MLACLHRLVEILPMQEPTIVRPGRKPPKTVLVFHLKISLVETDITRDVAVPAAIRLSRLHPVIQAAFGWHNCHLHEFENYEGNRFGDYQEEELLDDAKPLLAENRYRLSDVIAANEGATLRYCYDFGDDWRHVIQLIDAMHRPLPRAELLGGFGECPPEDCGGVTGYQLMLEALADPEHEDHDRFKNWLPMGEFKAETFNLALAMFRVKSVRI